MYQNVTEALKFLIQYNLLELFRSFLRSRKSIFKAGIIFEFVNYATSQLVNIIIFMHITAEIDNTVHNLFAAKKFQKN